MRSENLLNLILTKMDARRGGSLESFEGFIRRNHDELLRYTERLVRRFGARERMLRGDLADRKARHLFERLQGAAKLFMQEANSTLRREAALEQWRRAEQEILDAAVEADAEFPDVGVDTPSRLLQRMVDNEVARNFGWGIARAREEADRIARFTPKPKAVVEDEPPPPEAPQGRPLIIMAEMPIPDTQPGLWLIPHDHLGDRWRTFMEACSSLNRMDRQFGGRRYNGVAGTLQQVAVAVSALQREGFQVRAGSEAAAARLADGVRQANKLLTDAETYLADIVARLTSRGLTPRHYQMTGIRWLRATKAGALLDVMGLGKTMQCLSAMCGRGIVLCPASVKDVWVRECKLWRPDLKPVVMEGIGNFRWPDPGELLIFNYELLRAEKQVVAPFDGFIRIEDAKPSSSGKIKVEVVSQNRQRSKSFKLPAERVVVKDKQPIRRDEPLYKWHDDVSPAGPAPADMCMVIDEAHNLKNAASTRSQAAKAVAEQVGESGGYRWLVTATPICNRPKELRTLLDLIGAFGTAFPTEAEFRKAFGNAVDSNRAEPTPEAAAALAKVALRRTKEDVFQELPPVIFEDHTIKLTGEARSIAADLERELRPLVEAAKAEALASGADAETLARAIEGALGQKTTIGAMSKARRLTALARLPAAMEIAEALEDADEPMLVLSTHREVCEAFGAREGWKMIIGGVEDRGDIVEEFQAGKLKGLAITIKAGGTGLTLTRAYYGIAVDLWWNPAENEQAFARIDPARGRPKGLPQGPSLWHRFTDDAWISQLVNELILLKSKMIRKTLEPVAALGGQLPEATQIEPIEIGAPAPPPGKAAATAKGAPSHWITDEKVLDQVRTLAAEPKMDRLLKWLLDRIEEKGAIPPKVQGASVLAFLEEQEVILEKRKRKQQREREEYEEAARAAKTPQEHFAEGALVELADLDPDKVRLRNDKGFSASTFRDGHRLAAYIRAGMGLSDEDWKTAIKIAKHHQRQVGKMPAAEEQVEALARCGAQEVAACKDIVEMVHDEAGPIVVRTRCSYDPAAAEEFKRNIAAWRPHLEAWQKTLELIARKAGIHRKFRPGLLLCEQNKAFTTTGLGEPVVYLQPELLQDLIEREPDPHAIAGYLKPAADHELAHLDGLMGRGHDEEFIAAREDLAQRTGSVMPKIVEIAEGLLRKAEGMPRRRHSEQFEPLPNRGKPRDLPPLIDFNDVVLAAFADRCFPDAAHAYVERYFAAVRPGSRFIPSIHQRLHNAIEELSDSGRLDVNWRTGSAEAKNKRRAKALRAQVDAAIAGTAEEACPCRFKSETLPQPVQRDALVRAARFIGRLREPFGSDPVDPFDVAMEAFRTENFSADQSNALLRELQRRGLLIKRGKQYMTAPELKVDAEQLSRDIAAEITAQHRSEAFADEVARNSEALALAGLQGHAAELWLEEMPTTSSLAREIFLGRTRLRVREHVEAQPIYDPTTRKQTLVHLLIANPRPLRGPTNDGGHMLIAEDGPGDWVITFFNPRHEPTGHVGPWDFESALERAAEYGPLDELVPALLPARPPPCPRLVSSGEEVEEALSRGEATALTATARVLPELVLLAAEALPASDRAAWRQLLTVARAQDRQTFVADALVLLTKHNEQRRFSGGYQVVSRRGQYIVRFKGTEPYPVMTASKLVEWARRLPLVGALRQAEDIRAQVLAGRKPRVPAAVPISRSEADLIKASAEVAEALPGWRLRYRELLADRPELADIYGLVRAQGYSLSDAAAIEGISSAEAWELLQQAEALLNTRRPKRVREQTSALRRAS